MLVSAFRNNSLPLRLYSASSPFLTCILIWDVCAAPPVLVCCPQNSQAFVSYVTGEVLLVMLNSSCESGLKKINVPCDLFSTASFLRTCIRICDVQAAPPELISSLQIWHNTVLYVICVSFEIFTQECMYLISMNKEYDDLLDQIMKHIRVSPDDIDEHLMTEVSTTVFYGILVLMARKIMTDEEKKEFISAVTRTIKHKLINEFMQQSKGDKLVVDQEDFVLSLNKILDEMEKRLRSLLNTH